jgi:hypothetical protein
MDVFLLIMYASVTVNLTACTACHKSTVHFDLNEIGFFKENVSTS